MVKDWVCFPKRSWGFHSWSYPKPECTQPALSLCQGTPESPTTSAIPISKNKASAPERDTAHWSTNCFQTPPKAEPFNKIVNNFRPRYTAAPASIPQPHQRAAAHAGALFVTAEPGCDHTRHRAAAAARHPLASHGAGRHRTARRPRCAGLRSEPLTQPSGSATRAEPVPAR